jgi:hypothetical protein
VAAVAEMRVQEDVLVQEVEQVLHLLQLLTQKLLQLQVAQVVVEERDLAPI